MTQASDGPTAVPSAARIGGGPQTGTTAGAGSAGETAGEPVPPIARLAERLAAGETSARALLEGRLARIAAVDGRVGAFVHVAADEARRAADAADAELAAGRRRSALHGIPFAVKDNFDAAGLPTTAASHARAGRVAEADADLVARLKAAGAILVGKLATWEYGTGNGGEYFDLPVPPARNPWDLSRFTGGSSTGAGAAVAAGMVPFALGSDTTGSVRLPAAGTGTVGVIATPGRLSLSGILPNCHALDVPGPFAWTVGDAARVLDVLLGADPQDPASLAAVAGARSLAGVRIAVVRAPGPGLPEPDPAVADAFAAGCAVLSELGAELVETRLPVDAAACFALTRIIGPVESAALHEAELREIPERLGAALKDKLLAGAAVRAVDYLQALRTRAAYARELTAFLGGFDALVTYATLHLPPRLGVEPEMTAFTADTMLTPFNLASAPALAQPNGFSSEGLPTAWQIAARPGAEAAIFRVAGAFEAATGLRDRRPPIGDARPADPDPRRPEPCDGAGHPWVEDYAARAGLERLSRADLARLAHFVEAQGRAGGALPRVTDKTVRAAFVHPAPPDTEGQA